MNILGKIIATNREALKKEVLPVRVRPLREKCFFNALKQKSGFNIIAELKKASPSKGIIREDFLPLELAIELEKAGAVALSVLTEEFYFKGSLDYLKIVAENVKISILRKDFIFDEYQIKEAFAFGADAILLIAAALSEDTFRKLLDVAFECKLDVLTEVHTMKELDFVLTTDADIIGVNSRNLKTFKTDLELTKKMLNSIPNEKVKVAESGIFNHTDLVELKGQGANAFLIGEALMRAESPGQRLKELL
jgi:indole-3-glycerol phosphate synthase